MARDDRSWRIRTNHAVLEGSRATTGQLQSCVSQTKEEIETGQSRIYSSFFHRRRATTPKSLLFAPQLPRDLGPARRLCCGYARRPHTDKTVSQPNHERTPRFARTGSSLAGTGCGSSFGTCEAPQPMVIIRRSYISSDSVSRPFGVHVARKHCGC